MRFLAAALIALLPVTTVDAEETRKYVDLDQPGAFLALRLDNPDHFAKAATLILAAQEAPCRWMEKVMEARVEPGQAAECGPNFYKMSYPAKRRIRFALDDTSYGVTVTLTPGEMSTKVDGR